jgi:hypothetical protein
VGYIRRNASRILQERSRAKIEEKSLRTIQRSTTMVFVMKTRLGEAGFVQQLDVDPPFISDKVLWSLCDDSLLFAKTQKDLDEALVKLRSMGLALSSRRRRWISRCQNWPIHSRKSRWPKRDWLIRSCRSTYWRSAPVDTPATGVLGTGPMATQLMGTFHLLSALWYLSCHFPTWHPIL